jgi:hypothetical protein
MSPSFEPDKKRVVVKFRKANLFCFDLFYGDEADKISLRSSFLH